MDYEDNIICPYCKHVFSDSWEYSDNDGDTITCVSCDQEFILHLDFSISFATQKKPQKKE